MTRTSSDELTNILIELFRDSQIIDQERDWIFLNRLWYSPEIRNIFFPYFERFLDENFINFQDAYLLAPEGISSSFGIIPFISMYAMLKNKYLFLWKEVGDILTVEPFIFPNPRKLDIQQEITFLIIQDVVGNGSLIYKVANNFKHQQKKWKIGSYLAIVQLDNQKDKLENNLAEISHDQGLDIVFNRLLTKSQIIGIS